MKFKVKIPKSFIFWIILFCIIALLVALFLYPDITDVFFYIRTAIVAWTALILLALIGAIFLSIGGFTPFEEEMLKMREDIKAINKKLETLIGQENKDERAEDEGKVDKEI
jgi:predicted membrane protein